MVLGINNALAVSAYVERRRIVMARVAVPHCGGRYKLAVDIAVADYRYRQRLLAESLLIVVVDHSE